MITAEQPTDLERMQELFAFLQGTLPAGYKIPSDSVPRLTDDQAWTICWYLGNQYWQPSDEIRRCDVCGDLFDSRREGGHSENGPPHHFCDDCDHLRPADEEEPRE